MDIEIQPEQIFSLVTAVAIIPVIVAHLKPALRRWWHVDGPWELVADALGVLWVLGIWQAGYAPEWVTNVWAAALTGVAVGVASGRARDAVQAVASRRSPEPEPEAAQTQTTVSSAMTDTSTVGSSLDDADLMQSLVPRESISVIKPS